MGIFFIEGLPGSGKTTLTERLAGEARSRGLSVDMREEGESCSLDGWACVARESLKSLSSQYPEDAEKLLPLRKEFNHQILLPYARLPKGSLLGEALAPYAVWDNPEGTPYSVYRDLEMASWRAFVRGCDPSLLCIWDCAFVQDHIVELMLFYDKREGEIADFLKELAENLQPLHPVVCYLKNKDPLKAIDRAAKERVDEKGRPVWALRVAKLIEECPYGRARGLTGYDGLCSFFLDREDLERRILPHLPVRIVTAEVDDDWEDALALFLDRVVQQARE